MLSHAQTLQQQELERLDTLVSEYLLFRSFKQTQHQLFLDKRSPTKSTETGRHERAIVQRLLVALDSGDYPRLITLWDTYISSKIGTVKSTVLGAEARDAEFLMNLSCAIYPFRGDVIASAGSPTVAAKVAARSMTIFKHYLETRGARLVQKDQEFVSYRNLFRIAFPPTHPQFKHLFSEDWQKSCRDRIVMFLEKFFVPADVPVLCQLYQTLGSRSEAELKSVFRRRERKLLKFSRSIFSLANDLLTFLEAGKPVDKAFLAGFRSRFATFEEVLHPDVNFDEEMGDASSSSPNQASPTSPTKGPKFTSPPGSDGKKKMAVAAGSDGSNLDFIGMSQDVAYMSREVGDELGGLLTRDFVLSSSDAAVICQTGMQGCILLQALVRFVLRPDKEMQPQSARNSAVLALSRADILGLRGPGGQAPAAESTGASSFGVESRSLARFLSSLAMALKQMPAPLSPRSQQHLDQHQQAPAYEKLLTVGELVAEYACRLITSLGTAPTGLSYLHATGVRITTSLAELLLALPLPVPLVSVNDSIYVENDADDNADFARPRSGTSICTWCLMAITVLAGQCKAHQLVLIKHGGIVWLSRALGHFVSGVQQKVRGARGEAEEIQGVLEPFAPVTDTNSSTSTSLFEACLSLLGIVLQSSEARRSLVSTQKMQRETEGLVSALILISLKPGINEDHAEIIVAVLHVLFQEVTTRELARGLNETTLLRAGIKDGTLVSITEASAQALLDLIDSEDANLNGNEQPSLFGKFDVSEILDSVTSTQGKMQDNVLLDEYGAGVNDYSGLFFLSRYAQNKAGRIFTSSEEALAAEEASHKRVRSPPIRPEGYPHNPTKPSPLSSRSKIPRTPKDSGIPQFDQFDEQPTSPEQTTPRTKKSSKSRKMTDDEDEEGEEDEEGGEDDDGGEEEEEEEDS